MEVSGQLHAPIALPSEKIFRYPLQWSLGEIPSGHNGEKKNVRPRLKLNPNPQVFCFVVVSILAEASESLPCTVGLF
jgi:hypothetical protein